MNALFVDRNRGLAYTAMTPEQLARLYYQLFNERRFSEATELVDPEAIFHYLPTRQRLVGRAGYRALAAAWLTAVEDAHLDVQSVEPIDAEVVVAHFIGRGTHTGDLVLGDTLTIPATGRPVEFAFRERFRVRNERIVEVELEFNVEEMKRRFLASPPSE
ncbi:MAG: ester cyclase [Acidobacteria bacterium]|nr:ester cyclase [Acidobacteriota bacterium]